jgi:hypothetical protein
MAQTSTGGASTAGASSVSTVSESRINTFIGQVHQLMSLAGLITKR